MNRLERIPLSTSGLPGPSLQPGVRAMLSCAEREAQAEVVGAVADQYFIVRVPGGETVCPRPGERIQVRITGPCPDGFEVELLGSVRRPETLLVLSWPFDGGHDQRQGSRVDCAVPVGVWSDGEYHGSILVNVSHGGGKLRFRADAVSSPELFSGDSIDLVLDMGAAGFATLAATIVNKYRRSNELIYGFAFNHQTRETMDTVSAFVVELTRR